MPADGIVEWAWCLEPENLGWIPPSPYVVSHKSMNLSEWQFHNLWYENNIYLKSLFLK